jgi:hypothetical protein
VKFFTSQRQWQDSFENFPQQSREKSQSQLEKFS